MKEVEDKIKKARGIAQQIEQALSNGDWEQVAPDSPRLHEEVGIPVRLHENIKRHDSFDTEKALNKFIAATRPKRQLSIFYKYAAAVACLVMLGIGYYFYPTTEATISPSHLPAQSAYLVLNDGKQIKLNQQMQMDYNGLRIINTNEGKVSFQHDKEVPSASSNKLVVPEGTEYSLQLSDGTNVHLNAGSTLIFPSIFGKDARVVELSGEGYFDVTHSNIPFIVKNKSMDVRVLGTTFNMTAYPEDLMVTTTLLTGKVAVTCHSQTDSTTQTTILTPGLQARFQPHEGVLQVDSVDVEEQTAWRRGEFAFEDVKLGNIMTIIGRSFALNVTFDTPELQDIKCFISIQRDKGYEEILKIIHIATGVNFKKEGNNIRVYK
ncbi:FecR family protein [Butyricimonas virosa]|jgi:transmembrane sensor|uniref:FecR domain-containing protein n=1 Tax=Butyricimonas virosa TaxID=544645 RepID=A0ABX7H069_9BACT|nr:FecR family protein [Butyricimonas virosa]MCI7292544.1 FecR domain-containing protein [Butyricimonas virosa]MDY6218778.1 FecR domain-containing protein [Butyricimonas virosa]QRO48343.1 FecR domain-containing protein [Butyricimonas virosa]UWO47301.1 FecR domain-containing protein [Butyricimonas virosa]